MRRKHVFLVCGAVGFSSACGAPESAPQTPTASGVDGSGIVSTYRTWDFSTCSDASTCAETFRTQARAPRGVNPKKSLKNPDPAWIPEWDSLPGGDDGARYVYEALVLAASNRTWSKRCDDAYETYAKSLDGRMSEITTLVARESADPNPYDRLAALLAKKPGSDPASPSEFAEGSDAARYEIEASVFDAFEATDRTFVYTVSHLAPSDAVLATMHKREPRAYEHDAYCLDASRGRIASVPKLPSLAPASDEVRAMVKPVLSAERIREIEKRRSDMADVTRAKFAKAKDQKAGLPPGVRQMSEGKVQRFERNGKGASVTLELFSEKTDASGKVQKIDEAIEATFADWPSGVVLDLGDGISFYGVEQKEKDTIIKSSPTLENLSRETSVIGKHLTKVSTKGKTLLYFPAPQ